MLPAEEVKEEADLEEDEAAVAKTAIPRTKTVGNCIVYAVVRRADGNRLRHWMKLLWVDRVVFLPEYWRPLYLWSTGPRRAFLILADVNLLMAVSICSRSDGVLLVGFSLL